MEMSYLAASKGEHGQVVFKVQGLKFFKREASHGAERNEPPAGVEQRTANQPDDKALFTINN